MSLPEVPPEIQPQRTEKSYRQEFIEGMRRWFSRFDVDAELERKFELERKLKEFHDLFDGLIKDGLTKENFKVYKLQAHAAEINEKEFQPSHLEDRVAEMNEKLKGMDDLYQKLTLKKFKIKKRSFKVINIDGENEAIDGNPDITTSKKHEKQDNTHEAIDGNAETTIFKKHEKQDHTHEAIDGNPDIIGLKKHEKQDHTVWAGFLALEVGVASCLGNPFDKLPKLLESTGKVKQQSVINSGEALRVFAQPITWNAILFGSFIFSTIHAPLGFRVSANSIQMLLLVYCILAEAEALSDCAVMWGSTQIPALLFVCGWAIVPVLLIASIIAGLKYSRFSPK
ncbi:uncharacterized protein LOC114165900 [Vigna unguiculata]|uniref:uncharacterized protein LOC114165900 n=1 Tax=Vigna unguiculata TaxID=3917 RepID=UPI001016B037|nr:uncharacterized protein LOC114165900 [Vigna unguiculata]